MRVLVVADFSEFYNRSILHGAAAFARQAGWELVQHHVTDRQSLADAMKQADALLLGAHSLESDMLLTRTSLPAVGWSATLSEVNWPRVLSDDLMVGRAVADHFVSLGLKHFAFFSGIHEMIWIERRREGFFARLETAGRHVITTRPDGINLPVEQIVPWLKTLPLPLGLMLVHDAAAIPIPAACRQLGLRIPEDIALVGVNNDDRIIDVVTPALSSVPLQTYQIGFEAAALLAKIVSNPSRTPWSILVPPGELIVRQSSDVMANLTSDVGRAVRFIRQHLGDGVEAKQVVAHIGVSRTTLNAHFIAALGRSVADEVRRVRLERCRQLLSTTDWPMPIIAEKAGFSSARQLSETFHRFTGITPTRFRDQFKTITLPS